MRIDGRIMIFANLAFALVLVASVGVDRLTHARVEWQTGVPGVAQPLRPDGSALFYRLSININCNSIHIYRITITEAES